MKPQSNQIDERITKVASLANAAYYDSEAGRKYIDGAPHIKHASLRKLYGELVVQVYDFAAKHTAEPNILDLGAGEGSVTLPFLELGAKVTAVDISQSQLNILSAKCKQYKNRLQVRCEDINETLKSESNSYDIIIVNAFLHHVPDYIGLIEKAVGHLAPHGQFFSFQDPLRYDLLGSFTRAFGKFSYLSWRIFKGDFTGGLKRFLRRTQGVFLDDCQEDNAEYHVIRNGVDQDAITKLFQDKGFDWDLIRYHSTQSLIFQLIGASWGIKNAFAVIARKKD